MRSSIPLQALCAGALAISAATPAGADTDTYDALGRLVQVTYDIGGSTAYTYDAADNRTTMGCTAGQTLTSSSGNTTLVGGSGNDTLTGSSIGTGVSAVPD